MASVLAPAAPILKASPATLPAEPALHIEPRQLQYLLRCVHVVGEGTPERIGISAMFLFRAFEMGYLKIRDHVDENGNEPDTAFSLSQEGNAHLYLNGGPFGNIVALRAPL